MYRDELVVFLELCRNIATPLSYKASLLAERGDWLGLLQLEVDPRRYTCARTYLGDAQVVSFWKKLEGLTIPGVDPEAAAKAAFFEAETQCYWTNERLSPLLVDLGHYGEGVKQLVVEWRKQMRRILGKAPREGSLFGKFGPGSTFANTADQITVPEKLSDNYTRTTQTASFLQWWDETAWSRYAACGLTSVDLGDHFVAPRSRGELLEQPLPSAYAVRDFETVLGNRFTVVEKNWKIKRGICIEPSLNVFLQLAVGSAMSKAMKLLIGWSKEEQQDYHRILARVGSMTGAVATIDLRQASDTLAYALVKLVSPKDWFSLFDRLRSRYTRIDGDWVRLEKFSSMGNGFTFELETAIFLSLALALQALAGVKEDACTPGLAISVFGDDIIVPTSMSSVMVKALNFAGFRINEEKSFIDGPFRESCGGDFHGGTDVRPIYLRKPLDAPEKIITICNALRRFYLKYCGVGSASRNWDAHVAALNLLGSEHRNLGGPEALGDLVIHRDESEWNYKTRNSCRLFAVWRPVPHRRLPWSQYRPGVVLATALYEAGKSAPREEYLIVKSGPFPVIWCIPRPATTNHIDSLVQLASNKAVDGLTPRLGGSFISGYKRGWVAYS